jgi:hypothetical protein
MSEQTATVSALRRPITGNASYWPEVVAVGLVTAVAFLSLQLYLRNVNIDTTNGLWKSIDVRRWIDDPSWQRVDFSNVLYYPVEALFCSLLERFGVFPGQIWRQMAVLNGLAGGVGAAVVYVFTLRWLRSRLVAALTTVLYVGSGFYLLLSVINEDIMPGAVLVLIASLLACAWFAQPTRGRIAIVAGIFSVAWLWQWALLFPSLPAMLLALFVARGSWTERFLRPAWFVAAMAAVPVAITVLFCLAGNSEAKPIARFLFRVFWAGKGVGTGWGGFTWTKVLLAWVGAAESVLGAENVGSLDALHGDPVAFEMRVGALILVALAAALVMYAWTHRRDPRVLAALSVLGGTLLAGTVFNLYAQPQDPQMVISVMIWTVPGWALVANTIIALKAVRPPWRQAAIVLRPMLVLALLWPLAYNVRALAAQRGLDAVWEGIAEGLAARFDPDRTVFLYQGFEGVITWQFAMLGGDYIDIDNLPPASAATRSFKYMDVTTPRILHRDWTTEQVTDAVKERIDAALDRGYQVVAGPAFLGPESAWVNSFTTVAKPEVPEAVWDMIGRNYRLEPAFTDAQGETFAVLSRRND